MGQSASNTQQHAAASPAPAAETAPTPAEGTPASDPKHNDNNIEIGSPVNSDVETTALVEEEVVANIVDYEDDEFVSLEFEESASNISYSLHDSTVEQETQTGSTSFVPLVDPAWMGRSIETLVLGYTSRAPLLTIPSIEEDETEGTGEKAAHNDNETTSGLRRRSTDSTFGGRRCSITPLPGQRAYGGGGTLARYPQARRDVVDRSSLSSSPRRDSLAPQRRRSSLQFSLRMDTAGKNYDDGPNLVFNLMARESTGRACFRRNTSSCVEHFRAMGGSALFHRLDRPSAGIASEVQLLSIALAMGNWTETHTIVSRLVSRLVTTNTANPEQSQQQRTRDPNIPRQAPKFYAGGGRVGLERDTFCVAGGVHILLQLFSTTSIVGSGVATSGDARHLSSSTVAVRLAPCWNEALLILRELLYFIPSLVTVDACWAESLPFFITLLSHDSCFEGAAAMVEEILSAQQQAPTPTTFCLAEIPHLYQLWRDFTPQQLSHFCRILSLLLFEPEDRALLETSAVIQSLDLLRLRRLRSARRDPTVDVNQALLLGDEVIIHRLVQLLQFMNYAPPLRRFTPYHVLARFPFVADTLVMLGLNELSDWNEFERQDALAARQQGTVVDLLENLQATLSQPQTQISHILSIITAAQRSGVIVGRPSTTTQTSATASPETAEEAAVSTFAGILTDQILMRRLFTSHSNNMNGGSGNSASEDPTTLVTSAKDAANSLQFNAMLLGPCQVECLFVLCILLGGRRKMDAQERFLDIGLVGVLERMFERLPFASDAASDDEAESQPNGIHGPNCDCTPESALCVQFLRLVHNLCDRDCDNYHGRQLMLSRDEQAVIAGIRTAEEGGSDNPGLLTKIIQAFTRETEESPYRFWLSSCIESFLRGSSQDEQLFVARSGLLDNLIESVCSERLHCAGSLQTSFDIMGEIGKGSPAVMRELVGNLDEERFCRLMRVATTNLVDSNVFIRSLLLTLERQRVNSNRMPTQVTASYLTHSWLDIPSRSVSDAPLDEKELTSLHAEWFSVHDIHSQRRIAQVDRKSSTHGFGWNFSPPKNEHDMDSFPPNTMDRLNSVLVFNQARLLRDLLAVINLENINHENICCANTAIILAILAHRRNQLSSLVLDLRQMSMEEQCNRQHSREFQSSFLTPTSISFAPEGESSPTYGRTPSNRETLTDTKVDVLTNFREIIWFWLEYYTHRGRDRLSLEFSSHIRFQEWETVVQLLAADDGSDTALLPATIRLPRSPYRCLAVHSNNFQSRRAT